MIHRPTLVWAGAFIASTALVKALYAAFVLLLATLLPPAVYAGFGLLYAAQTAMSTFAGVGIQETTIGRLKGRSSYSRRCALYREAIGLFYASASIVLAVIVLLAWGTEVTTKGILLALLLGALTAFATLQAGLIRLEERHGASLLYSAGVPLLSCVGGIFGVLLAVKLEAVFAGSVMGAALGIAVLGALQHGYFASLPRRQRVLRGLQAVYPFAVVGVFGWLAGYGVTFIVDGLFESLDVARYTFLFTVSSIAQVAASAMNMVWSPRFYRLYLETSAAHTEDQSRRFYVLQASGLGLVGAASVAILPWLTHAVGGYVGFYGLSRVELALLFAGYVLSVPWWHAQNYFLVANQGERLMRIVLWSGTVGIIAWLGCMLVFGPIGIYVGFMLQALLKSLGAWLSARRQWNVAPPWAAIGMATALTFAGLMFPGGAQ